MKILTMLLAPTVAVGTVSIAIARDYADLVARRYPWVNADGPPMCPTKEDLRQIPGDLKIRFIICSRLLRCIYRKWWRGMDYSWHVQHLLREFGCGQFADPR